MRQPTCYKELPENRQTELLEEYRKNAENNDWWHDGATECFVEDMGAEHGIDVDGKKIYFDIYRRWFSFQGTIHEMILLPKLGLDKKYPDLWPYIGSSELTFSLEERREDSPRVNEDDRIDRPAEDLVNVLQEATYGTITDRIEDLRSDIQTWVDDKCSEMVRTLDSEYDYQMSDEYLIEDIDSNHNFEEEEQVDVPCGTWTGDNTKQLTLEVQHG